MNTSTHPIDHEEFMAYLDGELCGALAATAAAHLESCAECRTLASNLKNLSQQMQDWRVESAEAMQLEEPVSVPSIKLRPWRRWVGARNLAPWAAGFAACLVLAGALVRFAGSNANTFDMSRSSRPARDEMIVQNQQQDKQFDRLEQYAKLQRPPRVIDRNAPQSPERDEMVAKLLAPGETGSPTGPMIARTAELAVTVQGFEQARATTEQILKRYHGYIDNLQVTAPAGNPRTLAAKFRIPSGQLDAVLADLKKLGRVDTEAQTGEEVTAQYVNLQARLANARNTEQRLTDVLRQRTGKLSDVLEVETEIARVRGEIESMEAERKTMATQVAYATLNLTLTEDYKAQLETVPPSTWTRFRNSAVGGYQSMTEGVVGLVVFFLSYGPSFLLWAALLFFPVRMLWRCLSAKWAQRAAAIPAGR